MTSPVTCRNEDHPSILVIEKNTYMGKLPHTKKGKVITMKVYVGIDAHTTNFTLATRIEGSEKAINTSTLTPEVSSIVKYCDSIKKHYGEDVEIIQESSIEDTLSKGARISLTVNTEKVNLFLSDGSKNILTGVQNDLEA